MAEPVVFDTYDVVARGADGRYRACRQLAATVNGKLHLAMVEIEGLAQDEIARHVNVAAEDLAWYIGYCQEGCGVGKHTFPGKYIPSRHVKEGFSCEVCGATPRANMSPEAV